MMKRDNIDYYNYSCCWKAVGQLLSDAIYLRDGRNETIRIITIANHSSNETGL
jgi:hypothetical protein